MAEVETPKLKTVPMEEMRGKFIGDYVKNLAGTPIFEQGVTAGVVGWCFGYISIKILKFMAAVMATGFFGLLLVQYYNLMHVDWTKITERVKACAVAAKEKLLMFTGPNLGGFFHERFTTNSSATVGFLFGILMGFAFS